MNVLDVMQILTHVKIKDVTNAQLVNVTIINVTNVKYQEVTKYAIHIKNANMINVLIIPILYVNFVKVNIMLFNTHTNKKDVVYNATYLMI